MIPVWGGFECGLVHGGQHDLLASTMHLPNERMRQHYRIAKAHGIAAFRDGLVPGHDIEARVRIAQEEGVSVVWDLSHYHDCADPEGHARRVAASSAGELWVCPVNEPEIVPMMTGQTLGHAVAVGMRMLSALRYAHPNVKVMTSNAAPSRTGWHDPFAEPADIIGVNVYPHTITCSIRDILIATHRRYGKPVMISETSWHDGYHEGGNKADWLRHVMSEAYAAQSAGVDVRGVCWYPLVDCPPWDAQHIERWSHGLIRADLSVDPALSAELMGMTHRAAA